MLVKVEDLRKGDVVILGTASGIFEAKLLRQPQLAKRGAKTTWYGAPRWSTVPCLIRVEKTTRTYIAYNGKSTSYDCFNKVVADGKEYTEEKRIDFTDKQVWLIKRETL